MNLSVLHCAETIRGGIATYLQELLPLQISEFGAGNVTVVIPRSQLRDLIAPAGVAVVSFDDRGGRVRKSLALLFSTLKLVIFQSPNVVHLHSSFAGAFLRPFLAGFRNIRVIYCAHGWAVDRSMGRVPVRLVALVERFLSYITYAVVCISEHDRLVALNMGISDTKLRVVLNGIAPDIPNKKKIDVVWPEGCLKALFVGRFDAQKGVDILLAAAERLKYSVHVVLAGGAVLGDAVELAIPENATLAGWLTRSEIEFLLANADVLVVPSRWEGFGLIAVEGMRAGLPIVASNVGGLKEIVIDGVTGVLIPPDSIDALSEALSRLTRDKLVNFGVAGRKRFLECYTIDRVHSELLSIYS